MAEYDGSALGLRSTGADQQLQNTVFLDWAIETLAQRDKKVEQLSDFADQPQLFIHLTELLSGKICPLKYPKKSNLRFQKIDCVSVAISFMKQCGVKVIGISSTDIVDGNENRILGLLSSLYQFFKRAQGTKSPRARTLNMAQSSKIVKPNTQRSLTLMSKSQSAVSSKTTFVVKDIKGSETAASNGKDDDDDDEAQNGVKAVTSAGVATNRDDALFASSKSVVGADKANGNDDDDDNNDNDSNGAAATNDNDNDDDESSSAAKADADDVVKPARHSEVVDGKPAVRSWKRYQSTMEKEATSLNAYADMYRKTSTPLVDADEESDDEKLRADEAAQYHKDAVRIEVTARVLPSGPATLTVPLWLEPGVSYDDTVAQLDARLRIMARTHGQQHKSNKRRPWTAPLVIYVSTEARGLLGSLADLADTMQPHAVALALVSEGEDASYEYRVLADDTPLLALSSADDDDDDDDGDDVPAAAESDATAAAGKRPGASRNVKRTTSTLTSRPRPSSRAPQPPAPSVPTTAPPAVPTSAAPPVPSAAPPASPPSQTAPKAPSPKAATKAADESSTSNGKGSSPGKKPKHKNSKTSKDHNHDDDDVVVANDDDDHDHDDAKNGEHDEDDSDNDDDEQQHSKKSTSSSGSLKASDSDKAQLTSSDASDDVKTKKARRVKARNSDRASTPKRTRRRVKVDTPTSSPSPTASSGSGSAKAKSRRKKASDSPANSPSLTRTRKKVSKLEQSHSVVDVDAAAGKKASKLEQAASVVDVDAVAAAALAAGDDDTASSSTTTATTITSTSTTTTTTTTTTVTTASADSVIDDSKTEAQERSDAERQAFKRNELVREIVESERKYVIDGLDVLVSEYLTPLRSNGMLSKDDVKNLFGDVEAIRNYNKLLLDQLEQRMKEWETKQQLGDIFLSLISFLKVYTMYVNKYNNALDTLVESRANKPKFAAFLDKTQNNARCGGLDIGAFLIMPIQRIPRYVMLLQELLRYTPAAHSDRNQLEEALSKMKDVADYVNERKREAENLSQVTQVLKLLTGKYDGIAAPHRRFVTQGPLGVAVSAGAFDASVDPKPYFVVLFNDMLVFAQTKAKVKKNKSGTKGIQLSSSELDDELAREHKYLGRFMLQHYGLVDGQALTATGGIGADAGGGGAAAADEWGIGAFVAPSSKGKKSTLPDIASHSLRLEPILPVHELPLAPDTAGDGFPPRAYYCIYCRSRDEKERWTRLIDEQLSSLVKSEVSRRLETNKTALLQETPANSTAAFANPDKKGTLYKQSKTGAWNERTVVLSGALMYYCKSSASAEDANVIDLRGASVQLNSEGERMHSFVMSTPERQYAWAAYDGIEVLQWIFAMRAATTRHFLLVKDAADVGKSVRRRGDDVPAKRDVALRALHEILQVPGNNTCHDCNSKATNFVDLEHGAVLCDECASIHIQLPGGMSDLKSIAMTKWDEPTLKAFRKANKKFLTRALLDQPGDGIEAAASIAVGKTMHRPTAAANIDVKANYIARLYAKLAGMRQPPPPSALDSLDGFLWRKPNANQAWRREPFRLRGASLIYDKQKVVGKHKSETISLQAAEVRSPAIETRANQFDVVTPTRIFSLAADSEHDMTLWILAILWAIQH